jgi:hypothetical protein
MTTGTLSLEGRREGGDQLRDEYPSEKEGDVPDPPRVTRCGTSATRAVPCAVWFGQPGPEPVERDSLAFLGAHNGVAVLKWPRDVCRASRCSELGIPCLIFVRRRCDRPRSTSDLQEWLPEAATDGQVHACLQDLSARAAVRRTAASLGLDHDGLSVGESHVPLDPNLRRLASTLVAHIGEAVEDGLLCQGSLEHEGTRRLASDLFRLDRCLNQVGLEVVPVQGRAHLLRRCRP